LKDKGRVLKIGIIADLYKKAIKWNILGGIIFSDLIAFIAYVIFPAGIFFFGDFQMVLGVAIGTRFALKHIKEFQSPIKLGIIAAVGGSILTAVSMIVFDWTIFSFDTTLSYNFLNIFFLYLLEALIIGLSLGIIIGLYYRSKSTNINKSKENLDELLESLKTSK
jgi:hypothetical protein